MNLGWMANNWGRLGLAAAKGGFGRTIQGATVGALGGAAWGAMSSDTSVLGGALMGAGLGAGGMRYGGAGLRKGWRGGQAFMSGMRAQARGDYRALTSNTNLSFLKNLFKGNSAPSNATLRSNAPRSRIIKRGTSANVPLRVPPGIQRLNRQVIPGLGGGSPWKGSRRNIMKSAYGRLY
jgi:hypothetical protein